MNATHLHLILNHAPAACVALGLLFLALSLWKKELLLATLLLYILGGIATIPVYVTGNSAEETIESNSLERRIEEHEEAAQTALAASLTLGVTAVLTLVLLLTGSKYTKQFVSLSTIFGLVSLFVLVETAYLGGQIRHDEIREPLQQQDVRGEE
jgi:hypothetical protein